jgi:hypothetical protein
LDIIRGFLPVPNAAWCTAGSKALRQAGAGRKPDAGCKARTETGRFAHEKAPKPDPVPSGPVQGSFDELPPKDGYAVE